MSNFVRFQMILFFGLFISQSVLALNCQGLLSGESVTAASSPRLNPSWVQLLRTGFALNAEPMRKKSTALEVAVGFEKRVTDSINQGKGFLNVLFPEKYPLFERIRTEFLIQITVLERTLFGMKEMGMQESHPSRFFALSQLVKMAHHFKPSIEAVSEFTITYQNVSDYTEVMARVLSIESEKMLSQEDLRIDKEKIEDIKTQMRIRESGGMSGLLKQYGGLFLLDGFTNSSSYELDGGGNYSDVREYLLRFPISGLAHSFTYLEGAAYGITLETVFGVDRMNIDFSEDRGLSDILMHDRQHEHILLQGLTNQLEEVGPVGIEQARRYMQYLSAFINHVEPGLMSSLSRSELFAALTTVTFNYYHEGLGGMIPYPEKDGDWEKNLKITLKNIYHVDDRMILYPMSAHIDEDFAELGKSPRKAIAEAVKIILKFNVKYRAGKVSFLNPFIDRY